MENFNVKEEYEILKSEYKDLLQSLLLLDRTEENFFSEFNLILTDHLENFKVYERYLS